MYRKEIERLATVKAYFSFVFIWTILVVEEKWKSALLMLSLILHNGCATLLTERN
jgi:hypothetical protein